MTHISQHDIKELDTEAQSKPENNKKHSSSKKSGFKRVLNYLVDKEKRADMKRAFHLWQIRPHEVAPQSEITRQCSSCRTEFQGNYCPRCGQASSVGKFSFKKALLHFLDVWGMGNRSMFRALRDLVFRPGYMIRDYLSGKQSAYFPPFKMFFILMTISLLIEHGFSLEVDRSPQHENGNYNEEWVQNEMAASLGLNISLSDEDKQSTLYKCLSSVVDYIKFKFLK